MHSTATDQVADSVDIQAFDVFLSHRANAKDTSLATRLAERLDELGIRNFLDAQGIPGFQLSRDGSIGMFTPLLMQSLRSCWAPCSPGAGDDFYNSF